MPSPGSYKGIELKAGTDQDLRAQIESIDAMNAPVSSNTLQPLAPLKIPPQQPATELSSFGSYLENLSSATTSAKSQSDTSFDALLNSLTAPGEAALTSQAYSQKGGVDDLQAELQDINAQLLGEQEGLRRTVEDIQNNAEGLTRGGVAGKIDEARRKSLRTQADLAVIQMAKQGRYDSAKAIADRAISAQLEKQKQRNEILQFIYKENKDAFTKAEQREFEAKQKERDRQLENEEYRLRVAYDAKIKQADPLYQAQLAKAKYDLYKAMKEGLPKQATPLQISHMQDNIGQIKNLTKDPALRGAVGTTAFGRFAPLQKLSGANANFIAGVQQLTQQLTLENLQNAKANGATFGALSEGELDLLRQSATKLNSWVVKDDKGNVTGYKTDAGTFQKELDRINYYQQLDYLIKGGDAASAGIAVSPDGKFWAENSDGTLSQLVPQQ